MSDKQGVCPVCRRPLEDKGHRLAVYIGDSRFSILPAGTPFATAKEIVKGFVDGGAYLVAETVDQETGRLIYSMQVYPHKPRPLYQFAG